MAEKTAKGIHWTNTTKTSISEKDLGVYHLTSFSGKFNKILDYGYDENVCPIHTEI